MNIPGHDGHGSCLVEVFRAGKHIVFHCMPKNIHVSMDAFGKVKNEECWHNPPFDSCPALVKRRVNLL